jgi:hypothetical protein
VMPADWSAAAFCRCTESSEALRTSRTTHLAWYAGKERPIHSAVQQAEMDRERSAKVLQEDYGSAANDGPRAGKISGGPSFMPADALRPGITARPGWEQRLDDPHSLFSPLAAWGDRTGEPRLEEQTAGSELRERGDYTQQRLDCKFIT